MALQSVKQEGATIGQLPWILIVDGHKDEMIIWVPVTTLIQPESDVNIAVNINHRLFPLRQVILTGNKIKSKVGIYVHVICR